MDTKDKELIPDEKYMWLTICEMQADISALRSELDFLHNLYYDLDENKDPNVYDFADYDYEYTHKPYEIDLTEVDLDKAQEIPVAANPPSLYSHDEMDVDAWASRSSSPDKKQQLNEHTNPNAVMHPRKKRLLNCKNVIVRE